jgi:mannose-6-phosphate isomerase-like protein (cupin superfamily)
MGCVLDGRLELAIDDKLHELGPGDSFAFPSNLAHTHRHPGSEVTPVIWCQHAAHLLMRRNVARGLRHKLQLHRLG